MLPDLLSSQQIAQLKAETARLAAQDANDVEGLDTYAAVRLFVDRAKSVDPDFEITRLNAAAVVEIANAVVERRAGESAGDAHLIAVRGEVHVSTAPEFSERLNDAIAGGKTAAQQALRGTVDPMFLGYTLGKLVIIELRDEWLRADPTRSLRMRAPPPAPSGSSPSSAAC